MATIPDYNDIQRRPGSTGTGVVRLAGNPLPEAMEALSGDLKAQMDVRNKQEVARATNAFLLLKAEQDNAFDDDPEFETIPSRYKSGMDEGLSLAAQKITDPQIRQAFQEEMGVRVAEGEQRMVDLSREKRRSKELGDIANEADILLKEALRPGSDINHMITAMDFRLNAAAEAGVTSQEQAQRGMIAFRNKIATEKLTAMPPSDRLSVFEDPPEWLSNIDAGTLARLQREAEEEKRIEVSQQAAMYALDQGMGPERANSYLFEKLGPGREYAAARNEYNAMYSAKETARVTNQRNAAVAVWEALHPPQGSGVAPMSLADIRMHGLQDEDGQNVWEQLTQPQRAAFLDADLARSSTRRQQSDRVVTLQTYRLYQRFKQGEVGAGRELFEYITDNINYYNDTDWKTWSEVAATGEIGEPAKPLFSAIDEVQLLTTNWGAEEKLKVLDYMNKQYYDYRDQYGQDPPPEEVSRIRRRAFEAYSTSSLFDFDDPMYAMPEDQKLEYVLEIPAENRQRFIDDNFRGDSRIRIMLQVMQRQDPARYERAVAQVEAEGGPPTYERIEREYKAQAPSTAPATPATAPSTDDQLDPASYADPGGA